MVGSSKMMRANTNLAGWVGRFAAAGALAVAFPTCSSDHRTLSPVASSCQINSDCDNPLSCTFGKCHQGCSETRDCPLPQHCIKASGGINVCQLVDEQACTYTSECPAPLKCAVDSKCRNACVADVDCLPGQRCADRSCAESSEIGSDDHLRVAKDGGSSNDASGPLSDAAGASSNDASTATNDASSDGAFLGTDGAMSDGSSCPRGTGDCDNNPNDCETDFTLPTTCGACNVVCSSNHASVTCDPVLLKCVFATSDSGGSCESGYADCDLSAANGCEAKVATDVNNCGRCGRSCGTATCASGGCGVEVVLNPGVSHDNVAVSAQLAGDWLLYVYANPSNGGEAEIRSIHLPLATPDTAGTLLQAFSHGAPQPKAVASDGADVYFSSNTSPYSIYKTKIDGTGTPSPVFTAGAAPATTLHLSATAFYFTVGTTFYTIAKTPGTSVPTKIPGLDARGAIGDDLLVSNQLFWLEDVGGTIHLFRAPVAGGTPIELDASVVPSNQTRYSTLTTDGSFVYYSCSEASEVRRVPVNGASTDVKVIVSTSSPMYPLVDDTYLYFNTDYYGIPKRVKKDGSDPFTVEVAVDNYGIETKEQLVHDGFLYDLSSGPTGNTPGLLVRHRVK